MFRMIKITTSLILAFFAVRGSAAPTATITDLGWVAGAWSLKVGSLSTEVFYTKPDAGTLVGVFRVVENGSLAFFEYERIVEENGTLVLYPSPMGAVGVAFTLRDISSDKAVFENLEIPFPQTIAFSLDIDKALHITASGTQNGAPVAQELVVAQN